ncbi:hypothetical protein CICLE_v10017451mg, partial [Citrus x clementina]
PKKDKAPPSSSKPAQSGGGKQKKKQKEKVNNMVLFDQGTYDKHFPTLRECLFLVRSCGKVSQEGTKMFVKLCFTSTGYVFCGATTIRWQLSLISLIGSLASRAIKDLVARGSIRMISAYASQQIYTRVINT